MKPCTVSLFMSGWLSVLLALVAIPATADQTRPNILWLSSEDHGQEMGCYGDPYATTPNVDALAKQGMLYRHVWSCAPVCAPARTTIITGMYPTRLGAEHMRSMVDIPRSIRLFPEMLQEAGYYCSNRSKEDYNVTTRKTLWNESSGKAHWRGRTANQPFFAVFNSTKSHESSIRNAKGAPIHDPAQVSIPKYHPDTPTVRRDWALYYDMVSAADADAGAVLKQLEADGLHESTIVFYWGDHGSGMPRSKRWPSDSGLRVPLVVYVPETFKHLRPADYVSGGQSERLVSFIDFAPTVLSLAGIQPPAYLDGKAFLGPYARPAAAYLYGFRGRMDERLDLVRSITDGRYVYLRNFMPHLSQAQHVSYQFETPTTAEWATLFKAGKLTAAQQLFWQAPKPAEELYDLHHDPDEINNLANSQEHQAVLATLRSALQQHLLQTRDWGFIPEGERRQLAGERTLLEAGSDDQTFPIEEVMQLAWMASQPTDLSDATAKQLQTALSAPHPALRYWGVMGHLMRPAWVNDQARETLCRIVSEDNSVEVQIAAAQTLIASQQSAACAAALQRLVEHASSPSSSVFTVMAALRALDEVANVPLSAEAKAKVRQINAAGNLQPQSPHARYESYVPRLLESIATRWQAASE